MRMQDMKNRAPSSRVLQELISQAPAEYVTIGWLTSTLQRHSFGIIMLCLGLLATTPVGSSVPGFVLAVMAVQLIVGRAEPVSRISSWRGACRLRSYCGLVVALFMF
jgi:hypothetical protein